MTPKSGAQRMSAAATVEVVGLGPAGPELLTTETAARLRTATHRFLRTGRHPAAEAFPEVPTFDHLYETLPSFAEVYEAIVEQLVATALTDGEVVYAVPGSPSVAERTVELLRDHPAVRSRLVELVVRPAVSFLDVAFERLGVDPVAASIRLVDGSSFAVDAAGSRGPLLVAQCWDVSVLSEIKLAPDTAPAKPVTVLFHLGLPDERIWEVPWEELDRSVTPDHLTSLWIPVLDAPVAAELVQLEDLVRVLRERCPWDRRQTHGSLRRHLLEESYEVLEALDEIAVTEPEPAAADERASDPMADAADSADAAAAAAAAALEEELGDLLFQVFLHSRLAAEAGRFTLADVARGVHDKLVDRHPHVFGEQTGPNAVTAEEVADSWEIRKLREKQRSTVTEGIPASLPALALGAKLQRKASAVGMVLPGIVDEADVAARQVAALATSASASEPERDGQSDAADAAAEERVGDALFAVVSVARDLGVDPEAALRARLRSYRSEIDATGRS